MAVDRAADVRSEYFYITRLQFFNKYLAKKIKMVKLVLNNTFALVANVGCTSITTQIVKIVQNLVRRSIRCLLSKRHLRTKCSIL